MVRAARTGDVAAFFAAHRTLAAIVESGLEGQLGSVTRDRGRGLAMPVSAALMQAALTRGPTAAWSASHPVSKRLAERPGCRPAGECEVLLLR
jgi:hypothetical protein